MRYTASIFVAAAALATASAFGQSQTKIYGFADAQFNVNFLNSSFTKQFVATDTFEVELNHVNIYFDFRQSERLSALVEVALQDRPVYETNSGASDVRFSYKGNVIGDDQAKAIIVQAQMAQVPSALPQSVRDSIQGVIESKVDAQIAAMHAGARSTTSGDKLGLDVARAYVDLNIVDAFKLRVGKFITPAGVWNVDHGSPVIIPVRQPAQTSLLPIFPEAQTGMMGYGTMPLGDHDLNYSGYITSGRIDGASTALGAQNGAAIDNIGDMAYGGHVGIKLDILKSVALGVSYFNGARRSKYELTEVTKAIEDLNSARLQDVEVRDVYTKKMREYAVGGDAAVEISNLRLQGELNYGHIEDELTTGTTDLLGWYGLVAWSQPVNENVTVTPYAMYESVTSSIEDGGTPGSFQRGGLENVATIIGGVNVALFSNLHLKSEYTYLTFKTDSDTWQIAKISDDDLTTGIWSTQVSVAF